MGNKRTNPGKRMELKQDARNKKRRAKYHTEKQVKQAKAVIQRKIDINEKKRKYMAEARLLESRFRAIER
jgi:hypothetical protein